MFSFLTKRKNLQDYEDLKNLKVHKSLNWEERQILKKELSKAQKENDDRSEEDKNFFYWAIRGITAKKIYIDQNNTKKTK